MSKFGRKIKQAPAGYEDIEPTITALENELRESKSNFRLTPIFTSLLSIRS